MPLSSSHTPSSHRLLQLWRTTVTTRPDPTASTVARAPKPAYLPRPLLSKAAGVGRETGELVRTLDLGGGGGGLPRLDPCRRHQRGQREKPDARRRAWPPHRGPPWPGPSAASGEGAPTRSWRCIGKERREREDGELRSCLLKEVLVSVI